MFLSSKATTFVFGPWLENDLKMLKIAFFAIY